MKKRDYTDFIQDIIESVEDIGTSTYDITFEDFIKDRKTINAVIRNLEVIGEATKKIPYSIFYKKQIPCHPLEKDGGYEGQADSRIFWHRLRNTMEGCQSRNTPLKRFIR